MQKIIYSIDKGRKFGLWKDSVSKLMYFDCMEEFLTGIDTSGNIADYGGANGNLKHFIPNSISIDIDSSKNPDILDNILTHTGNYDLIVIRYVLHYLTEERRKELFEHLRTFHSGKPVLIIQFVNNGKDFETKKKNSINESKYFLTGQMLSNELKPFKTLKNDRINYEVTKDFYRNRLNNHNAEEHSETVHSVLSEI